MGFGVIHNSKVQNYKISDFTEIAFQDLDKFINENQPFTLNASSSSFFSDSVIFNFDYIEIAEHFAKNPVNAYLEVTIDYTATIYDNSLDYVINILGQFCLDGIYIDDITVQKTNEIYTNIDDGQTKIAKFRVYSNSLPKSTVIADSNFGFMFGINCKNPTESTIDFSVNSIEINIYSSTYGSYISIFDYRNKRFIEENEDINLGFVKEDSLNTSQFAIYNFGSEKMFVAANSITSESKFVSLPEEIDVDEIVILPGNSINVPFVYETEKNQTNYQTLISLQPTANNIISIIYSFTISYESLINAGGRLGVYYNDIKFENNSILSLPTVAQAEKHTASIILKNIGINTLNLQLIEFEGMILNNAQQEIANVNLASNENQIVQFSFYDFIVGNGTGKIKIYSTDSDIPIFDLNIKFAVKEAAKLNILEGNVLNFSENILKNNQLINLGTLVRYNNSYKYFTLRNTGISKDIEIISIQTDTNDARIVDSPILPLTLKKFEGNNINFTVMFDTINGLNKETSLVINYNII